MGRDGLEAASLPEFALDFSTRITNAFDGPLDPFLALAGLFGFVPDFVVLTASNTSSVLRTSSACSDHRCILR
jgi:hypothetical protein